MRAVVRGEEFGGVTRTCTVFEWPFASAVVAGRVDFGRNLESGNEEDTYELVEE